VIRHVAEAACQICLFQNHGGASAHVSWDNGKAVGGVLVVAVIVLLFLWFGGSSNSSNSGGKK